MKNLTALVLTICFTVCQPVNAIESAEIITQIKTGHLRQLKSLDAEVAKLRPAERKELLDQVIQSLKSPNWEEQANAAHVAGLLGPDALPAVPALIAAMDAKMENVAWEIAPAIGKIGAPAVPQLVAALREQQPLNRESRRLLAALAAVGPPAASAVPAIVRFLPNGINSGAVKALEGIGPLGVKPLCQTLQSSPNRISFVYAAKVLGQFDEQADAEIAPMLKNKEASALAGFCYVLSKTANGKYTKCIPGLADALRNENNEVWQPAQTALILIGSATAPTLRRLVRDDDMAVQRRVATVLQHIGAEAGSASPSLQAALSDKNPETAALAAASLLKINPTDKAALAKLLELLQSNEQSTRLVAAHALGQAGPGAAGAVTRLAAALKDSTPHVRAAAAEALGEIGPAALAAVPALLVAATSTHPAYLMGREMMGMDSTIQQAAMVSIGKIGPTAAPGAVPTLIRMLTEGHFFPPDCILQTLAQMKDGASPAVPALINALTVKQTSKQISTRAVINTLIAIGSNAEPACPALEQVIADKRGGPRKDAFNAVLLLETDAGKKNAFINRYIDDQDHNLKSAALAALAETPAAITADSLPVLLKGLESSQYSDRLSCTKAVGNLGAAAVTALPLLIKPNIGSSHMKPQRELAFEAIKKIDPSGEKVIPILEPSLSSSAEVRSAVQLLEFIGSSQTNELAAATRAKWKMSK